MRDVTRSQHIDTHRIVFEPLEERCLLSDASPAAQVFSASPAVFVENDGQWADSSVRYAFQRQGAAVAFTDSGLAFSLGASQFTASFVGARTIAPVGLDEQSTVFNYYIGDSSTWRTNVLGFSTVEYANLWNGIDLSLSGDQGNLKYQFNVSPGADPNTIAVSYSGVDSLSIDAQGNLLVTTSAGTMSDAAPVMYQETNGKRVAVAGSFKLLDDHTFGFAVKGAYDPKAALVIDPTVGWSLYLGGTNTDNAGGIALDPSGNILLDGTTISTNFVGANNSPEGKSDAFLAKVSPTGGLLWATYIGGSLDEIGSRVAVDSQGNAYVVGDTVSGDLPLANNSLHGSPGSDYDAFVAKVNASGVLLWSTYVGGTSTDWGCGIALDSGGNPVICGFTESVDLPNKTNSAYAYCDGFVAKLTSTGATVWSTYVGGSMDESFQDIAVDTVGNMYVSGNTDSTDLSGALNSNIHITSQDDVFLAKLNSAGTILWASYLSDTGPSYASNSVAYDAGSNCALVGGATECAHFAAPTNSPAAFANAYVTKVNSSGTTLWTTYLGGSGYDWGTGVAVDSNGTSYLTGGTGSSDFVGATNTFNGGGDAFVAEVNPSGTLQRATYVGGLKNDEGRDIVLKGTGTIYLVGNTTSSDFIGAINSYHNAGDTFLAMVTTDTAPTVATTPTPLSYSQSAGWTAVDPGVAVADVDSPNLAGAWVWISGNYASGQDVLSFTNQNGIFGSWSAATGILTMSGSANVAQYQAALRSVAFANASPTPSLLTRTISFKVNDGIVNSVAATRSLNLTPDVAPVMTTTGMPLTYMQGNGAAAVDSGAGVSDSDSANLASATVWISGNFASGQDTLAFTNQNGITGNYNASTGVMTLTGSSSVANYQAVLRSLTFRNSSVTPSTLTRTVSFKVNDGILDSNTATRDMNFVADVASVVTTTGTPLNFLQMNGAAAVDPGVAVTDSDSAALTGATVSITGNFASGQDVLAFTNQNGITGSYNSSTGVLTLTGTATVANYQDALASVTYADTSATPSLLERTISFRVNDGIMPSNTATRAVDITPDAAPQVTTTATPLDCYQASGWAAIDPGVTVTDSDNANLTTAWVWISGNFAGAQDVLGFVNQNGITGSYNTSTGVMTLTGTSSVANYQTALRTVAYANTGNPPSTLQRTFSFRVNDGAVNGNTATRAANITADAVPVVTPTATPLRYVDGEGWVYLDSGVTVTDADSANLTGATIAVSANYVNGQDVLGFTNQNGITGSWNAATGVMTLSGSSSVANYQTALRSMGYYWITASGTPAARTISFQLSDGIRTSAVATRTVNIARLGVDAYEYNDASWISTLVTLNDSGVGTAANATIFAATGSDTDWFRFTVPYGATGAVAITVGNVGGGLKAHIGLYDSILGTLADQVPSLATLYGPKAQIDGSTANGTVTLNASGLTAGTTYYVKVTGLSSTHGIYDLGVTTAMLAPDAFESNDTSGAASNPTASLISGNGACCLTSLSLHRSTDEDWFRVNTPANTDGNLVATVSHLTGGVSGLLWVYQQYSWGLGAAGLAVYASYMPGGAGTATIYNAQPNTTYYIRVDNFWAETGGYQLDVTLPLDQQAKDAYEPNDASWAAHPLTLTGNAATVNNLSIHNSADQDWFSFMPTSNGTVTITVSGVSGGLKTHIGLYDSVLGTMADQYGGIYTTLFGPKQVADTSTANQTVVLSFSGLHAWTTYYVKISPNASTTGLYTLGIAFTPTGSAGDVVPEALATA